VHDIYGVEAWEEESELGDPSHEPSPAAGGSDLVLVFRSDLFRRYPETLLYIAPAPEEQGGGGLDWEAAPTERLLPSFQGSIGDDITFFRFDVEADEAISAYWTVLEEPPSGYTFLSEKTVPDCVKDGAEFAKETFANPVRVMIKCADLIP
jgi:hypothetical protein